VIKRYHIITNKLYNGILVLIVAQEMNLHLKK
jgi:hypothetical protein